MLLTGASPKSVYTMLCLSNLIDEYVDGKKSTDKTTLMRSVSWDSPVTLGGNNKKIPSFRMSVRVFEYPVKEDGTTAKLVHPHRTTENYEVFLKSITPATRTLLVDKETDRTIKDLLDSLASVSGGIEKNKQLFFSSESSDTKRLAIINEIYDSEGERISDVIVWLMIDQIDPYEIWAA